MKILYFKFNPLDGSRIDNPYITVKLLLCGFSLSLGKRRKHFHPSQRSAKNITMLFLCVLFIGFTVNEGKITEVHPLSNHHISPNDIKAFVASITSQNKSFMSCPAPRLPLTDGDCKLPTCANDGDCVATNQSCCFNGCLFTCTDKLSPPPVIDWDDDLEPPLLRREGEAVLRCTTSPRPAPSEPVGCPKGFICKIDDHGNPFERRYNSGVCVPDATTVVITDEELSSGVKEKSSKHTIYLPGGCILSDVQYKEMKDFMERPFVEKCMCVEGSVECQLSK